MKTRFLSALLPLLVLAFLPLGAQVVQHDDHDHTLAGGICGHTIWDLSAEDGIRAAEQTRRNNPELYRRMVAQGKERRRLLDAATLGDEYPFYVRNRVTNELDQVTAVVVHEGPRSRIWVQQTLVNDSRVSAARIRSLARGLDTASGTTSRNPGKGIIENDIEVYGNAPTPPSDDGNIHFLINDIKDGLQGGAFVAGYFYGYDQLDPATNPGSNGLNLLYIDIQGMNSVNEVLNTMAHEFQHNIHYNTFKGSDVFFNEGCSEEASILNGYPNRGNSGYRGNTNLNLFRWSHGDGNEVLKDYERAGTFVHYLREQFGEGFLGVFNRTRVLGITRIDTALMTYGRSERWRDVLKGFALANYIVKNYGDPRYVYQTPISGTWNSSTSTASPPGAAKLSDNSTAAYTTTYPTTGSITLAPYGIAYLLYNTPEGGGMSATFSWPSEAAVFAIAYQGKEVMAIHELTNGQATSILSSQPYTKIVYALVNMREEPNDARVDWTLSSLVSGVDRTTDAATLAISSLTPNPAHENATIELTSARGGEVELELFDGLGTSLMRRTVDAAAGRATVTLPTAELPSGAYIVRVRQGGASATRSLVVAH